MLSDSFRLGSKISPEKHYSDVNVDDFFREFHRFYTDVRLKKNPSFPRGICDPYGFWLLCEDFDGDVVLDGGCSCREVVEGEGVVGGGVEFGFYRGRFSFVQLLNLLYRGFWFDFDLAVSVFNVQHDVLSVLRQIMGGRGYVMNRFRPDIKEVGRLMNFASESKICLSEDDFIPVPYLHRVCDGLAWPCIVSKHTGGYRVVRGDVHGWGDGLCVVDVDDCIVDVLKVNDTWLTELPLSNRLRFGEEFVGFDVVRYGKCWSLRGALDVGRRVGADSVGGVLVRPCHEDFFRNRWFVWSRSSLVYCCSIGGELTTFNVKTAKPNFFTLDGGVGRVSPVEERVWEKMWLDDFDIGEFRGILGLG